MFTIFCIVAAWLLPLPLWLQIVLTITGFIRVLADAAEQLDD